MKKGIALLLSIALLASLAACDTQSVQNGITVPSIDISAPTAPTAPSTEPTQPPDPYYQVDHAGKWVVGGDLDALVAMGEIPQVSYGDAYKGTPGLDYSTSEVFTFRTAAFGGQGLQWSPMNWQTAEDAFVLEYTTTGFYCFTLNSDLSGWTIIPELASAAPVDVTSEYVDRFGIAQGETARAWKISLREDLYWSNGEYITAKDFLYSYQQLLDSRMQNYRAGELCQGHFAIAGAAAYLAGTGSWEDVGILQTGPFELVLITCEPVAQPEFYVPYYLQSTYLVYQPLWEKCKQYWDADGNALEADCDEAVSVTTTYGTSLKTSVSYGPYVLDAFQEGEALVLERNFLWFGYADGKHLGQFQTDRITCQFFSNYSQILEAFQAGKLDSISIQPQDAAQWVDSGRLRVSPESYTTKLTFNTDAGALLARGTQILSNPCFRQALALAIDRNRFSGSTTMPESWNQGLINGLYLADYGASLAYRDTAPAQKILQKLYPAQNSLIREQMQLAYDQCVEAGLYDGKAAITLQLSVYRLDETTQATCRELRRALENACQGTGFAEKVTLEVVEDPLCYQTMAMGQTDLILTTWGGNVCDPYSILYHCYCSDSKIEFGFDPAQVMVQLRFGGTDHTASLLDWAGWCAGIPGCAPKDSAGNALLPFRHYDAASKAAVFAELEFAYLSQYVTTPLYSRSTLRLLSEKGDYPVANYRALAGFGGVRYYTFAYTDLVWEQREV